jgi:hypothetical protein
MDGSGYVELFCALPKIVMPNGSDGSTSAAPITDRRGSKTSNNGHGGARPARLFRAISDILHRRKKRAFSPSALIGQHLWFNLVH